MKSGHQSGCSTVTPSCKRCATILGLYFMYCTLALKLNWCLTSILCNRRNFCPSFDRLSTTKLVRTRDEFVVVMVVSSVAVIWVITQRFSPKDRRCVTTQITAAEETIVMVANVVKLIFLVGEVWKVMVNGNNFIQ